MRVLRSPFVSRFVKVVKTAQARLPVLLKFPPLRAPLASASQAFGRDGVSAARQLTLAANFNFPASITFLALAATAA